MYLSKLEAMNDLGTKFTKDTVILKHNDIKIYTDDVNKYNLL